MLAGYSQPHIHNVLAGSRGLSLQLADELLAASSIPLAELLEQGSAVKSASALLLEGRLGAGRLYPRVISAFMRLIRLVVSSLTCSVSFIVRQNDPGDAGDRQRHQGSIRASTRL